MWCLTISGDIEWYLTIYDDGNVHIWNQKIVAQKNIVKYPHLLSSGKRALKQNIMNLMSNSFCKSCMCSFHLSGYHKIKNRIGCWWNTFYQSNFKGCSFDYFSVIRSRQSRDLQLYLKKGLWRRCFLVNFAKFLRTLSFTEHLWWLLLSFGG